jgi:hypothetical protein
LKSNVVKAGGTATGVINAAGKVSYELHDISSIRFIKGFCAPDNVFMGHVISSNLKNEEGFTSTIEEGKDVTINFTHNDFDTIILTLKKR